MRVPGWARGEVVPGDLYRFADTNSTAPVRLRVNGKEQTLQLVQGYAVIDRGWKKGDVVDLALGLKVHPCETLIGFASVIVPMTRDGLRADLMPAVGLETSF